MSRVPLAILDLAPISAGSTARQALNNTLDLARHAEQWGYHRYWVAEHHFVAVASASPAVLIGLIAAATDAIRVGSAAVQVGHHTATAVVEAFGTIDALYPGRVDLGLGRSGQRRAEAVNGNQEPEASEPRTVEGILFPTPFQANTPMRTERFAAISAALQHGPHIPDFDTQLDDILALLAGTYRMNNQQLSATPGKGAAVQVWLFGSSGGQSAQTAGARGLPFVANYHVSPGTTLDAVHAYRQAFRPSDILQEPYVVVSADVVVADTDSQAEYLAKPFGQWVYSIRSGAGAIAYPNPATVPPLRPDQRTLVQDRLITQFVGSPSAVADKLERLQRATGAQELVVTTMTYEHQDRLRSFELLATEWSKMDPCIPPTPVPAAAEDPSVPAARLFTTASYPRPQSS